MPTNWIALTGFDLIRVISTEVIKKANQNTDPDAYQTEDGSNVVDPALQSRADDLVGYVIAQFRGAIQNAGKYPLSVTPNCVPPEVAKHVLNMAAFELVNSTPNLQMIVITEKGAYSPFQTFYKAADDYLIGIGKGQSIVTPTDPTGQDYVRPVDNNYRLPDGSINPNYNPALEPVRVGAGSQHADLQTDQTIFFQPEPCFPVDQIGQP